MAAPVIQEDEIGRKWDKCITDSIIKLGGGVLIGGTLSLLFFKRRQWPIVTGGGFGLGFAYSNCERDLNLFISTASASPSKK